MDRPFTTLDQKATSHDVLLRTDQLLADLGGRSTRGGALMVASDVAQLVINFVATLVLARLLVPADFGLVAMVASIMGFVSTVRDFGLPMATVQKRNITHAELSGVFWLNFKLAVGAAIVLAAISPVISLFYGESRLTAIMLVMTAGVFAIGSSTVHMGLLRRQMRFGAISAIELSGAVAGVAAGIVLALKGAGFWALVFQQVITNLVVGALLWVVSHWRPALPGRASGIDASTSNGMSSMVSYGKFLTASRLVNYVGKNLDVVLLGKFAGATSAGLYQKSGQWAALTFQQVYSPLGDVLVASFSRLQHDPSRYHLYFRKALMGLYFITAPAMAFAFVESYEMIMLLGEKWIAAVPIFRAMTICTLAGSAMQVARWVYLAEGSTKRQLNWSLISTPILVASVVAGLPWGAIGVAWSYTAAVCTLAYPGLHYCFKRSTLEIQDFVQAVWRPLLAATLAATTLVGLRHFTAAVPNLIAGLARDAGFMMVMYAAFWVATRGGRDDLREMFALLRHLRSTEAKPL